MLLVGIDEARHLDLARLTPGRPVVDDNRTPAHRPERRRQLRRRSGGDLVVRGTAGGATSARRRADGEQHEDGENAAHPTKLLRTEFLRDPLELLEAALE
jgi:hypothetical protein